MNQFPEPVPLDQGGLEDEALMIVHRVTLPDTLTGAMVKAIVIADNQGLHLGFKGYGDFRSVDGFGRPILIELFDSKLTIHVWADILKKDRTHVISLEGARESRRDNMGGLKTVTPELKQALEDFSKMQSPSIVKILRGKGYDYEAEIAERVVTAYEQASK